MAESGFHLRRLTTHEQKQELAQLPRGRISSKDGTRYYVFPAAQPDEAYVGRQADLDAYKALLRSWRERRFAAKRKAGYPDFIWYTPEPSEFPVRKFVGFGPLHP